MLYKTLSILAPLRMQVKKICVVGGGFVGAPTAAVLARYCKDLSVICVDTDADRISMLNNGKAPFYEPDLDEIISEVVGKNLAFSTDTSWYADSDLIFLCVPTPTKCSGIGADAAFELAYLDKAIEDIAAKCTQGEKIIVEKSTVPVLTGKFVERKFRDLVPDLKVHILSNPEFLAEGTAVDDLLHPDRVLIGAVGADSDAVETLCGLYCNWVSRERIIRTDLFSSELAKLASNTFLALRLSAINAFSVICEKIGADINAVSRAVGADQRIGKHFLKSTLGFGGSCFKKDILYLIYLCQTLGQDSVAKFFRNILDINDFQKQRFCQRIFQGMNGVLRQKHVIVLGCAFKPETSDIRESPALDILGFLAREGSRITLVDPFVNFKAVSELLERNGVHSSYSIAYLQSLSLAIDDCSVIIICTGHQAFHQLDYFAIFQKLKKPAHIFDGTGRINCEYLQSLGFITHQVGK